MGLAFHAWLVADDRSPPAGNAPRPLQLVVSVVLFFCHIAAYAAFCVMAGLAEATPRAGESRRAWLERVWPTPLFLLPLRRPLAVRRRLSKRVRRPRHEVAQSCRADEVENALTAGIRRNHGAGGRRCAVGLPRRLLTLAPAMRWPLAGLIVAIVVLPSAQRRGRLSSTRGLRCFSPISRSPRLADRRARRRNDGSPRLRSSPAFRASRRRRRAGPQYARQADDFRRAIRAVAPGAGRWSSRRRPTACTRATPQTICAASPISSSSTAARWSRTLFTGRGMRPVGRSIRAWTTRPGWQSGRRGSATRRLAAGPTGAKLYDTLIALHVGCDWRPRRSGLTPIAETPQATIYRLR